MEACLLPRNPPLGIATSHGPIFAVAPCAGLLLIFSTLYVMQRAAAGGGK
jgi:hypothetical protein